MHISLRQYYDILIRYLRPQMKRFLLLAALVLASIGLQIVNPQIVRYFIDSVKTGVTADVLLLAALLFIGVALVQQVVGVGAAYMGEYVAWVATNTLREDLAAHCLRLDMQFHHERSPGELIERIEGDALEFATFFSQMVLRVAANLLLLLGIIIVIFFVHWQMGLAFALFTVVTMVGLYLVRGIAVPFQKTHRDAVTDFFGFLEERLAGTEDIRSCGAVGFTLRRLFRHMAYILRCWRTSALVTMLVRLIAGMLLMSGFGVAFLLGYALFRDGLVSIGEVYMVVLYTGMIAQPIRDLTRQVESLQTIGATVERMSEILSQHSAILDGPGALLPAGKPLSLEFDGVSFAYSEETRVLRDVSFRLQPGKVLGLLGRTGSGKTTIARLVFRLYDPQEGAIRLGGTDIRQATVEELRHRVAFVTQDVQLFQASVRDNITFFDRSIPDERIMEVIDTLELGDWFAGLPNGLDTRLQTGGRSLSAGEGQLLAFTRVFLRDPGLVILDEASSRLDPATEALIERAIDHLLENRSAIIIAHRLGTLGRANEVLVMEDGRVLEYGGRLALLADKGSHFHGLHRTGLEEVMV
jgi:ABC-type multidrug transport system fused ATPase/permease subunit